jgi:hypothetical protein
VYTIEWSGVNGLYRRGIASGVLKVGDRVVAKGNPRRDVADSGIVFLRDIERVSDGWGWGGTGVRQGKGSRK